MAKRYSLGKTSDTADDQRRGNPNGEDLTERNALMSAACDDGHVTGSATRHCLLRNPVSQSWFPA